MPDNQAQVGSVSWSTTLPFVRLFSSFSRAVSFLPLLLGLAAVVSIYVAGRVLDVIWVGAGCGVVRMADLSPQNEIRAYASMNSAQFESWRDDARARSAQLRAEEDAAQNEEHRARVREAYELIDTRLAAALRQVRDDAELSRERRRATERRLKRGADALRIMLAGGRQALIPAAGEGEIIGELLAADEQAEPERVREETMRLAQVLAAQRNVALREQSRPRGPFIELLEFQMSCFAGAIQGLCSGRLGFAEGDGRGGMPAWAMDVGSRSASAAEVRPAMLASVVRAARGLMWTATQRPLFAIVFGLMALAVGAFFGGAICRIAAVQTTRGESLRWEEVRTFACEKFASMFTAPLMPLGIFAFAGVLMMVGTVLSWVPGLNMLTGLLYVLALLGGVALVFTLVGLVFGFHLMWPTIAVECSDAFDAVQRGMGWVYQRAWSVGFYVVVVLIYGGISFVVVRLLAMLLLKLTHAATGAGMSVFGWVTSSRTSSMGPLDAMWSMPAWQDLPLLPSAGGVPFWGQFAAAPLSGTETVTMFLLAVWVFLVVSLVAGFVVSFYHCASTEMYLLLRREVDGVDYDEIYYEGLTDGFEPADAETSPSGAAPAGSDAAPPPEKPAGSEGAAG